jgi:hypothetical protein
MAPMLFIDAPERAKPEDAPSKGGPSMENRDRAFETRRQAAGRAAAAAGAARSDNQADLLGQGGRTTERRKVGQIRSVLGY